MAYPHQETATQSCNCTAGNPGSLPKNIYNAAETGNISKITEWLKTSSVDMNSVSQLNRTVLHFACLGDQPKVIETMMMKNVCLNTRDNAGETPLMIASRTGHKSCVELLLKSRSNNRSGACIVDVDALTKFSEKTALNLAQEELVIDEKEKNFQDIVYMLRRVTNLYASSISITQTRNNMNEEPIMVDPSGHRVLEADNSVLLDDKVKKSLVVRVRDGIQNKCTFLWTLIKSFFFSHCTLLLDLFPWVMQLMLVMITLCLVTGYRSSIGFVVRCNNRKPNISVMSSIAFPLNLNAVQQVANSCNNSNQVMKMSGDFSSELYFVAVVASMTCALLVWIIVYHSNKKSAGMNFLYVDLPVLIFTAFFWLCASCDLAVAITKLKNVLQFDTFIRTHNAHFCDNMKSCIEDIIMIEPYTLPLDFGCFFGFVIFFSSIIYLIILAIQYKSYLNLPLICTNSGSP